MKTFYTILLIIIIALVVATPALAAGPRQEATPPATLPDWAVALINVCITFLVTAGLKSLSKTLPWIPTIQGQATSMTAALVGFIVVFANGLLSMIPPEYIPAVVALFAFIGTILSAYGLSSTIKQFSDPELLRG